MRTRAKQMRAAVLMPLLVGSLAFAGCGYTTRPGLPPHLKTVHVVPFENKIAIAGLPTRSNRFPIYRHNMELDLTNAVIERYQFTGLIRPVGRAQADCILEGSLVEFRRDALRYDASRNVEEWRLNLIVDILLFDQVKGRLMWEEKAFSGDTTYFASGPNAESEAAALDRAIQDLARRIVERTVEDW